MTSLTAAQPTQEQNRLIHLDVLRGFALLGILLVNFALFTAPIQSIMLGPDPSLQGIDATANWLVRWLAEGKFYALFSMLFGAGFALTFLKAEQTGASYRGVYFRRLLTLLLIGTAHMLLVWSGDILLIYATLAFIMWLLFSRTPQRRLWKWAIFFFLIPVLLMWLGALSIAAMQAIGGEEVAAMNAQFEADYAASQAAVAAAATIHAEGSWVENIHQRWQDLIWMAEIAIFWIPAILGYFLIGRWLLVSRRLIEPQNHVEFFRKWRLWGLLLGLSLSAAGLYAMHDSQLVVPDIPMALGVTLAQVSAILLSLGYLSTVVLSVDKLRFLAPAGRMALTNYLVQSLFWTWMFLGYGVGLWGEVPRSLQVLLAFVFFALQIVFSQWWLKRFRFGPAEWLWRSLTYLKAPPMRR
ncbi:MAG: DUF418 domain-containing protein [Pseudomonadota bacterium]